MKLQSLVTSKRLEEGLRPGDLEHLILNKVSIDQFDPKTGDAKEVYSIVKYLKYQNLTVYKYMNCVGLHML